MDDRLQSLLNYVGQTAAGMANSASDMAHTVERRAAVMLSERKINLRLLELRTEVSACLRKVGEMVYATHTGQFTDSDMLLEKLREIDDLNAQIHTQTQELQKAKRTGAAVCPSCGRIVRREDRFCRSCGTRMDGGSR